MLEAEHPECLHSQFVRFTISASQRYLTADVSQNNMRHYILSILSLFIGTFAYGDLMPDATFDVINFGNERGNFVWTITGAQLLATASWNGPPAPPPFDLNSAYEIALKYVKANNVDNPLLLTIDIRSFDNKSRKKGVPVPNDLRRWFYVFNFDPNNTTIKQRPNLGIVVVLMDGTLIEGKRPNPFKRK